MDGLSQNHTGNPSPLTQILKDPYLAIIALAPLYLLFASSNWIFSPPESIDPWVYHGFFRNLQEYKTFLFPGTYYGSRLSWLLPGFVAYQMFPPVAANYVLHLSFWYATVVAAYYMLKTTAGREPALIGSLFLGSFTYFLRSIGWDYVDGPANAYFVVSLAFLTAAACRGSRLAMALAGAFFAAVVYTNLFTIVFAPVVAVYFALLSYRVQEGRLTVRFGAWSLVWFLSGSAALTALLACANFLIEGNFLFYLPSIRYVLSTAGQPNPWKQPVSEWVRHADWLVLPTVVAIAGLLAVANARFRASLGGIAAVVAYTIAFLLMIFCERLGIPVLQFSFYSSYLMPTMLLVIGAILATPPDRLKASAVPFVALAVLLANSLPLWGHNSLFAQVKFALPIAPLFFGAVLSGAVLFNSWMSRSVMAAALVACHLICVGNGYAYVDRHAMRESFARIVQAAADVDAVRQGEGVRFWYQRDDPRFGEFNALNSIYLWGYTLMGSEFPAIQSTASCPPGSLLVIPSSDVDALAKANEALREMNLSAELVDRREIHGDHVAYSLLFLRVTIDYSHLHPLKLLPCATQKCQNLVGDTTQEDLPLDGWIASAASGVGSVIEHTGDGIRLTTVPSRYGNSAKYGPLVPQAGGRYVFRLHYVLSSGRIIFGALSRDESRWLAQANVAVSRRADQTALLSFEAGAGEPFWLMTANNHPAGDQSSEYVIKELEAYEFPSEEMAVRAESATP